MRAEIAILYFSSSEYIVEMRAVSLYGIYNAFDMYIIRCLVDVFQERDVNEEFIPQ